MLEKRIECDVEYAEVEIQSCVDGSCSLMKTASHRPDIFNDVTIKKNHAYLYVIAMGAGDYYGENKNGDFFWEKDLIKYHPKFLTSGVFIQHDNKDPNKSKGKVLKSVYNKKMHRVELLIEVKKELAPDVYYAIERGDRIAVSMGTKVVEESCSYCGHITKDSLANRCEHLKRYMHQIMPNGVKVCAINHPPLNFFDISIVRRPADTQGYAMFQKIASDNNNSFNLYKKAEQHSIYYDKTAELIKRIEALSAVNPLRYQSIKEIKSIPTAIVQNFIKSNDILLRPSELIGITSPNITEEWYNRLSSMDTPSMMIELIKHIMEHKPEGIIQQVRIVKMANAVDYNKYPVFNELLEREELVKEALEKRKGDAFGNKSMKVNRAQTVKIPMHSFAAYQLKFVNGDTITTADYGFREIANTFIPTGAVHSIIGILPNGVEKVLYHQKATEILDK